MGLSKTNHGVAILNRGSWYDLVVTEGRVTEHEGVGHAYLRFSIRGVATICSKIHLCRL